MTIPAVVDKVLKELIAGIAHIKEDFITGLYLTGSIPLQDYHPGKSDIDFLVLCKGLPDTQDRLQLKAVHKKIEQEYKHSNLSGSYLTAESLDVSRCNNTRTFSYHERTLGEGIFGMAPITLYELNTTALTITGLPAQQLPIVIHIDDVYRFLFYNINSYWKTWVDKHAALHRGGALLILFPRQTEWVILGVARQLYTLRTGKIASKTAAGYYCLEHLPASCHWVMQRAINIRTNSEKHFIELKSAYYVQPCIKRAAQTLDCAYFIIDQFNREYNGPTEQPLT